MAKKKLTPYEKAQRQFVQLRIAESGKEKSPETRQRFRQRFDTLAAEKEGRTRLAQRLLPGEGAEERKNFKRMLATDLPSRKGTGGTGTGGTGTGGTGPVSISWQQALRGGIPATQKTTTQKTTTQKTKTTTTSQTTTQSSTKGRNAFQRAWQNRENNIIGSGLNYPGRKTVESVTNNILNPLGYDNNRAVELSPKGLAKVAGQELAEAVILVAPLARGTAATAKGLIGVGKLGTKGLTKLLSRGGGRLTRINKSGGVGKVPYGPVQPPAQLALGPGSTTAASTGRAATTQGIIRMNKKGGVGSQPYGPQRPYGPYLPPAATTKPATTKPAPTKPAPTKPAPTKPQTKTKTSSSKSEVEQAEADFVKEFGQPKYVDPGQAPKGVTSKGPMNKGLKKSKEQLDDEAYNAAAMKNRFPGSTEKDAPFVAKLNRAQEAIEKKSAGYENYAKWLKNEQTQATIARLKRKK